MKKPFVPEFLCNGPRGPEHALGFDLLYNMLGNEMLIYGIAPLSRLNFLQMYKFMIFLRLVAATSYLGAAITPIDSLSEINITDSEAVFKVGDRFLVPLKYSVEYYFFNVTTNKTSDDGYIAVSPCHLQMYLPYAGRFNVEYTNGRLVQIDTTLTGKGSVNPSLIGLVSLTTGIDLKLGLSVSNTDTTGVDYACIVEPGRTCQAFVRPHAVSIKAQGVIGRLQDLMLQSLTQVPEVLQWTYPIENTGTLMCLCDDQVENLACEARINYYDPFHPIHLEYRI